MIMSKKAKNVHLIRTDGPSRLGRFVDTGNLFLRVPNDLPRGENVNMYITVDEEIKLNDYITDGYKVWKWKDDSSLLGRKKVVLSDDPTLLDSGVQAIPNDFLEWFVNNPSCQYGGYKDIAWDQIITLKEELKQEFTTVNGSSGCTITVTDEKGNPLTYWGGLKEPKQEATMKETIEEAAKNYANYNEQINKAVQEAVKLGAKWQQEQDKNKYSEEEVLELLITCKNKFGGSGLEDYTHDDEVKEWFEQFKKK